MSKLGTMIKSLFFLIFSFIVIGNFSFCGGGGGSDPGEDSLINSIEKEVAQIPEDEIGSRRARHSPSPL